jgi:uncharacterized repeat protein (TIGR03803 family)
MVTIRIWAFALAAFAFHAARPAHGQSFDVLYNFPGKPGGANPAAPLLAYKGLLYGSTPNGGASGDGALFSISPKTGAVKYLHSFDYTDGDGPSAALVDVGNTLWGVTPYGGPNKTGTLFTLDPATKKLKTVYAFNTMTEGQNPAALIAYNGLLYGTLRQGQPLDQGAIFSFDPSTGVETTLYVFSNTETGGSMPFGPVIIDHGTMYGTCQSGSAGGDGGGDIFAFDLATNAFKILYQFPLVNDGSTLISGLVLLKGALYGTTDNGGQYNSGTVFKLDIKSGKETVLHNFNYGGTDGYEPLAGLTYYNGLLYGTTALGGIYNGNTAAGIVYSIDPSNGSETIIYTVPEQTVGGDNSVAQLLAYKGSLFGTYYNGGTDEDGTAVKITP